MTYTPVGGIRQPTVAFGTHQGDFVRTGGRNVFGFRGWRSGSFIARVGAFWVSGLPESDFLSSTISHCAWRRVISFSKALHVRLVVASPEFTFSANLGGGKRMEDEALQHGIQRVGDASNDAT
ncbi:MAG TPA: hypothetical protein VGP09_20835, partial [Caballeronia sp.]|nr:hypothetical protein [Caballeronia sp.]